MNCKVTETSFEQAWRVILAMQTDRLFQDFVVIARISCYLGKTVIAGNIEKCNYSIPKIKKFRKKFPFNLLPIPSPNYFYLYDINLCHIYDLALLCDDYLMFEIAFIDKNNSDIFKEIISSSEDTLYSDMKNINVTNGRYFFCGFDFDDPTFSSGVSKATCYNFIPDYLSNYFKN